MVYKSFKLGRSIEAIGHRLKKLSRNTNRLKVVQPEKRIGLRIVSKGV